MLAFWNVTALAVAFAVVSVPAMLIALVFAVPSTRIVPAPAFTVDPANCVTPAPFSETLFAPLVEMLPFTASAPPAVVSDTKFAIVPPVIGPVTVRPPVVSFTVSAPPRVIDPSVPMVLSKLRFMELVVFAVTVPTFNTLAAVCVTAPAMLPPPITNVPEAAFTFGNATVLAFWNVTALAVAFVVVSVPAMLIALVFAVPSIRIVPAPAFTVEAANCVTPVPFRLTEVPPVMLFAPKARTPPAVVIDTALPPVVIAPVSVNPSVESFTVNDPFVVNAPRLVSTFAPPSVTLPAVFPVSVPVLITPVCVTAPVTFPPTPIVVVPAPVVTFPSATDVAFWIVAALAVAFVVVNAPARLIAPPPPFTAIVPEPAFTVVATACVTPPLPPVTVIFPPVVVTF